MYTGRSFNEQAKMIGFFIVLVILLCLIVYELRFFSSSFLGAFTLYILLRRPHRKLIAKGWKKSWATSFLVIAASLSILIIGGSVTGIVYAKMQQFNPQTILENIRQLNDTIVQKLHHEIVPENFLEHAVQWIGKILPALISATGNVIANVILMILILYFMLAESEKFEHSIENLLPLSKNNVRLLKHEAHSSLFSNAIGTPMIMAFQAALAALSYWFTGAGDPIIWGILTGFAGLIPVIGTVVIWLPLAINLLIGGFTWQGIVLLIWGTFVIALVENVFRMIFLKRYADVHPLIPLFGVMLGINVLGFWGIIFGPLMISGFLLLVKIFHSEFLTK